MTTAPNEPVVDAHPDQSIQWCLLSHTNIGKTTLARTLLADDIGEIQDAAHVTSQSDRAFTAARNAGSWFSRLNQVSDVCLASIASF